jgi:hypothetical protein
MREVCREAEPDRDLIKAIICRGKYRQCVCHLTWGVALDQSRSTKQILSHAGFPLPRETHEHGADDMNHSEPYRVIDVQYICRRCVERIIRSSFYPRRTSCLLTSQQTNESSGEESKSHEVREA